MDVAELVVGAIVGAVSGYLVPKWYEDAKRYLQRKNREKRQSLLESKNVYEWLIGYYDRRGSIRDLFDCKIGRFEVKIPFLTKREWQYIRKIQPEGNEILQFAESSDKGFEIDWRLIKRRIGLGQRLFNEPTLYLDRLEQHDSSINLHVKSCEYFQMATLLVKLEEETFRAVQKNDYARGNVPLRDECLRNLTRAQELVKKPFSIGCVVALAVRIDDSYEIVIQTRAHSTITFGGTKSGIPNFGLTPIVSIGNDTNILLYNFIREYCEELFSYDELIEVMSQKRADPFWFYNLREAEELLLLIKSNGFALEFLGFGFDALNGTSTIALLAVIEDARASTELKRRLCANWEVAKQTRFISSIEFVDYKSPQLESWLRENRYHFAGAYAISRAIERLDQLNMEHL
jgi:hypothetical protein